MWVLFAHIQTCTSLQPTQNKHKHPNTRPYHTQSQTHPHPNTPPPCASKKTQKYPDTISSLSRRPHRHPHPSSDSPGAVCLAGWARPGQDSRGPYRSVLVDVLVLRLLQGCHSGRGCGRGRGCRCCHRSCCCGGRRLSEVSRRPGVRRDAHACRGTGAPGITAREKREESEKA